LPDGTSCGGASSGSQATCHSGVCCNALDQAILSGTSSQLASAASGSVLGDAIGAAVAAANPIKPMSCDYQFCSFIGCFCNYSSEIDATGVTVTAPATATFTPVAGGVAIRVIVSGLQVSLRVSGDLYQLPYDSVGVVTYASIEVDAVLDISASSPPSVSIVAVRPASMQASVGTVTTNFSTVDGWIINNVIVPIAQGPLRNIVVNQTLTWVLAAASQPFEGTAWCAGGL
jgi:hypothetical protein